MSNLLKLENLNYYFKTHEYSGSKNLEASWTPGQKDARRRRASQLVI